MKRELVPDHIKKIIPYLPGKPLSELERELGLKDVVKLASNENPLGPSPLAVEAIKKHINEVHFYPDDGVYYLRQKLASVLNLSMDQVIIGNGTTDILGDIARAFLAPEDYAVVADQTFLVYRLAVQAVNGNLITVPLKNYTYDLPAMANAITPHTKLVYIANPNNPTGTMVTSEELDRFLNFIPEDIVVALDEAYYEYIEDPSYPDSLKYVREGRPVIVLRTFSKIYGLAGLRIGYAIAREELIQYLIKVKCLFNTNHLAQVGAMAALDDHEFINRGKKVNREGYQFLTEELKKLKVEFITSVGNFILLILQDDPYKLYQKLLRKGVIVRPMRSWNLPQELRVTIGTHQQNLRFIKALKESL
ncbi:MAG: histidinol-phosphate transaminase [Acidobacteriota bacterium]